MILAFVHFHLYGFLILFFGTHKELEKHSFKHEHRNDSLQISDPLEIFSA